MATKYASVIWGLKCLQSDQMYPCYHCPYEDSPCCVEEIAKDAQTLLEDRAVLRAQATWLPAMYDDYDDAVNPAWDCSFCGAMVRKPTKYCPRCGAKMEQEAGDPQTVEQALEVLKRHGWQEDKDQSYFLKLFDLDTPPTADQVSEGNAMKERGELQ